MRARALRRYRHTPDRFCPIWSDADRLPNGNTFIVFGTRSPMDPVAGSHETGVAARYMEVTPVGEVMWEVALCPSRWGTCRAERILREIPRWV